MKNLSLIHAAAEAFLLAAVLFCGTGCQQNDDNSNGNNSVVSADAADAVAAVKNILAIGYAAGDSSASVCKNITLAATNSSYTSVAITWSSDKTDVIADDGTVTLPDSETAVTLTASITCENAADTKSFVLTVIGKKAANDKKVVAAKSALAVTYADGDSAASVTQNVTLPTASGDAAIAWSSDKTDVIADNGTVTLPDSETAVTLTATLTCGSGSSSSSDTKKFTLTVINSTTAQMLSTLVITYADGDSAGSVTKNITLPETLSSYSVTWESNHTKNITTAGVVARDIVDTDVTLTATVKNGTAVIAVKTFSLTVKRVATVSDYWTNSTVNDSWEIYTFNDDQLTYDYKYTKDHAQGNLIFTFTADTDAGTLTATLTELTTNGHTYTKNEYTTYLKNIYSAPISFYETVSEDNDVTYNELISLCQTAGYTYDEAEAAVYCYDWIYGEDSSIEDYKAALKAKTNLTEAGHTAANAYLAATGYSSWDAALTGKTAEAGIRAEETFSAQTFYYTLTTTTNTEYTNGYMLTTNRAYDSTKEWWQQSNNRPDYDGSGAYLSSRSKKGNWYLSYNDNNSWNDYAGVFNSEYTTFTETSSGKIWNIASNGTGTLTLTNGSTTYTVKFKGVAIGK